MNIANKTIFTGDNLPILRGINSECINLIYLDPPFNSNANYAAPIGSQAAGAEFKDTWSLNDLDVAWLDLIETKYPAVNRVIQASMTDSDKSYLIYMATRLLEMHRILKTDGSIYLHCDPTMSHYLKLLMDAIFGRKNFRNEIVWHYEKWTNTARYFQRNHDIIMMYSATDNYIFNKQYGELTERQKQLISAGYNAGSSSGKKIVRIYDRENPKVKSRLRTWEQEGRTIYDVPMPEGKAISDVWNISVLNSQAREYTGYPTQKPSALLERIIEASSNKDGIVFDPFCGCATTCVAAERLQRNWVGIDISPKAVELVVDRIKTDQGLFQNIIHRTDIPHRTDLGNTPPYNTSANKKFLYGEQAGNCNGCNTHFEAQHLEIDHIIARSVGGTDHIDNLQLLCGNCNRIKGNRGQEYLVAKLAER
ncbi:hypothetical protein F4225_10065 [Candidatus Poribacteria bacterium]|nr:hypothetical protein [Candidatus Poribacteria bacterium]